MFAVGDKVIGNPAVATFAAFGSFAMLLLVDFGGSIRDRVQAQAALAFVGGVFVCVGTLASRSAWLGAGVMMVIGFAVLFAGVVSSVLAGATTSLLLALILSISLTGPISSIPDRLAGWGMAAGAALLAVALLWPAPARDPLRGLASAACRALATRLRSDVAYVLGGGGESLEPDHDAAVERATAAVSALRRAFFATPYRPTALGTATRMLVRLVDELGWVNAIIIQSAPRPDGTPAHRAVCGVRSRAASALECGADLLDVKGGRPDALQTALAELREAVIELESGDTLSLPVGAAAGSGNVAGGDRFGQFVTSLDPSLSGPGDQLRDLADRGQYRAARGGRAAYVARAAR